MRYWITLVIVLLIGAGLVKLSRRALPPAVSDGIVVDRCTDLDLDHPDRPMYEVMIAPQAFTEQSSGTLRAAVSDTAYLSSDSLPMGKRVHFTFFRGPTGGLRARIVP